MRQFIFRFFRSSFSLLLCLFAAAAHDTDPIFLSVSGIFEIHNTSVSVRKERLTCQRECRGVDIKTLIRQLLAESLKCKAIQLEEAENSAVFC